jgi:nitrate/nitrite transporter NarK
MGLLALGWMVSQACIPSVNAYVIAVYGWRSAWMVWAVCLALAAPFFYTFLVNHPSDMGQVPGAGKKET